MSSVMPGSAPPMCRLTGTASGATTSMVSAMAVSGTAITSSGATVMVSRRASMFLGAAVSGTAS